MVAQKHTQKKLRNSFAFLNASYPKTHLIQSLSSLGSS